MDNVHSFTSLKVIMAHLSDFFWDGRGLRPTQELDVTNTGEWLQTLTYARHSWPLTSEGS